MSKCAVWTVFHSRFGVTSDPCARAAPASTASTVRSARAAVRGMRAMMPAPPGRDNPRVHRRAVSWHLYAPPSRRTASVTLDDLARELPYGSCPLPDVAGAGQLDASQVRDAAAAGVRTVIDLRPTYEPHGFDEAAAVREAGMDYVNIPVTPDTLDDPTFDKFLE